MLCSADETSCAPTPAGVTLLRPLLPALAHWCLLRGQVHAHLHLASPLVYGSPAAWVRARLLVRLLDDLLQRDVYDAELLGTSFSLSASETGLNLHLKVMFGGGGGGGGAGQLVKSGTQRSC